jgi:hypothetical protein
MQTLIIKGNSESGFDKLIALANELGLIVTVKTESEKSVDLTSNLVEDIHSSYKSSIPVLAKDWDCKEDEHWDNY